MNNTNIFGYSNEPKLRYSKDGRAVASLVLCVPDYSKKRNSEGNFETDYINVVLFGNQANLVSAGYIKKGTPLMISGTLKSSTWETPEGEKRYSMEVVASEVNFVPRTQKTEDADEKKGGKKA